MDLKPDEIWEVFSGGKTFESFQQNILKPIYLKPNIPDEIKKEIKVVEKLLLYSYFEYGFIDLAMGQIIFILERVLRIRYREIHNKSSKKLSLEELIQWFFDNQYFETKNPGVLAQLRSIRNGKVHSETGTNGGIIFLQKLYATIDLINDVYEDQSLRIQRNDEMKGLQKNFNDILKEGATIKLGSNKQIIFGVQTAFLNNKISPKTLTIIFWPIFNPADYPEYTGKKIKAYTIELTDWEFSENTFKSKDIISGEKLELLTIVDAANKIKFEQWKKEALGLKHISSLLLPDPIEMNRIFHGCLRKFHRIN